MKVYRSLTVDIETGEVLREDSFLYEGPVALCKGGPSQQEMNIQNQQMTLENQIAQQQLGMQQAQIGMVDPVLQQIIAAGGLPPSVVAALQTQATQGLSKEYENAYGQVNNALVERGLTGGQNAGGGGIAQNFGALGASLAQAQSQALSNVQLQKYAGLQQAMQTALGIGSMYGQNFGSANSASIGAGSNATSAANAASQAQTGFWGALAGGLGALGGGIAQGAGAAGGFGALFGG